MSRAVLWSTLALLAACTAAPDDSSVPTESDTEGRDTEPSDVPTDSTDHTDVEPTDTTDSTDPTDVVLETDPTLACLPDAREDDDVIAGLVPFTGDLLEASLTACDADSDLVAVPLETGSGVEVLVTYDPGEGVGTLTIEDDQGAVLALGNAAQPGRRTASHVTTTPTTVYVRFDLDSDEGALVGLPYDLEVVANRCLPDAAEDDDTRVGAATPAIPYVGTGHTSCAGDPDWIAVPVGIGDRVVVEHTFDHAEGDVDVELVGSDDQLIVHSSSNSSDERLAWTSDRSGTVWVHTFLDRDYGSAQGNAYDVSVAVDACDDDAFEPDPVPGTPRVADAEAHNVCGADKDVVSGTATFGDVYTATVSGDPSEGRLGLEILDPSGTVVDYDTTAGDPKSLSWTVATDGRHSARVWLMSDTGDLAGVDYTITTGVETCPQDAFEGDDESAFAATPALPLVDAAYRGCLHDEDWVEVYANAGERVWAQAVLDDASEGSVELSVVGADGTSTYASNTTDGSGVAEVRYVANSSETHFVRAVLATDPREAPQSLGAGFSLSASATACVDDGFEDNDDPSSFTALSGLENDLSAMLCPGDDDVYLKAGASGDALEVRIVRDPAEGAVALDLIDESGQVITSGGPDGDDVFLSWAFPADQTIRIRVRLTDDTGPSAGAAYDASFDVIQP